MFPNASPVLKAQRTAAQLHAALEGWRSTVDSWFDGRLAGVNDRIAGCDRLIHQLRTAGHGYDATIRELQSDRDHLVGLRHSLTQAHQDREPAPRRVAASRNPSVHVEARAFVRENIDAPPDELRIRAQNHVQRHAGRLDPRQASHMADVFAATCLEIAAAVPRQKVASAPAVIEDFPDHGLFM